jgi:HPt (histidine-containing phosphotransfer) domain-containing protein
MAPRPWRAGAPITLPKMHGRVSTKQNVLLDQLRAQGKHIEKLSKIEHDLIKEVHPQVNEIKEGMEDYERHFRERKLHFLQKRAASLGFNLIVQLQVTSSVS